MSIEILRKKAIDEINSYWNVRQDVNGLIDGQDKEEVLGDDWENDTFIEGLSEEGINLAIKYLINLINYETPVIFENLTDEEINISNEVEFEKDVNEDFKKYNGKRIIFRNCPNLKKIEADCLNLINLEIEDCPSLEHLSAYNNSIEVVDFSGLTNLNFIDLHCNLIKLIDLRDCKDLTELYLHNNQLNSLILRDFSKLRTLYCSYNEIKKLDIFGLQNLQNLHCEKNYLTELDCSNLQKLKYLYCFHNLLPVNADGVKGLKELKLDGCKNLEELDCAENRLRSLLLDNHPKLELVACKNNSIEVLTIKDCPSLERLDFSFEGEVDQGVNADGVVKLFFTKMINTLFSTDSKSRVKLQEIIHVENAEFFDLETNSPISFEKFPNLEGCGVGTANDPSFEEWLDKKKQKKWEREHIDTPTCSYIPPHKETKDKKSYLTLTSRQLKGKLEIKDWPRLKILNVGNNELTELVIDNCPELRKVIYSHNKDLNSETVKITGCPKLEIQYSFNSNGKECDIPELSEDERKTLETEIALEEAKEKENDKALNLLESKDNFTNLWELADELNKINLDFLDVDIKKKIIDLGNETFKKLMKEFNKDKNSENKEDENKEKEKEKDIEIVKIFAELVAKAKEALQKQNLGELKKILTEMEKYANSAAYSDNKEIILNLKQKLLKHDTKSNDKPINIPLIIGFSIVSLGILMLLLKLLQNRLKKMLKFR